MIHPRRLLVATASVAAAPPPPAPGESKNPVTGQHIPSVGLSQENAAGQFQRITLIDVQVIDHQQTGRVRANGEKLCLKFANAEVDYRPTLADGTLGPAVKAVIQ